MAITGYGRKGAEVGEKSGEGSGATLNFLEKCSTPANKL